MSPLPRQGWLFVIEFLKWYFLKYWQVRTRLVFTQTVTYINHIFVIITAIRDKILTAIFIFFSTWLYNCMFSLHM